MCMLYLVLRAVDTIEDDMNIPPTTKVRLLKVIIYLSFSDLVEKLII